MKTVLSTHSAPPPHWVGDGFPVRTLFSYQSFGRSLSPFLLLDYAGPATFPASTHQRGVGRHPHRGFETVTIVYQGELEHRDSTGAGGRIGPGDVQWMTAGAGILHEERHSAGFAANGGVLEMVQLWVNLPQRHKMTAPRYQTILDADIPVVPLAGDAGILRLIAGEFAAHRGVARTFTGLDVWDLRVRAGAVTVLPLKAGRSAAIIVLLGVVLVGDSAIVRAGQWALVGAGGEDISVECNADSMVLVLSGDPIDEPIVGYGPFVMTTQDDIRTALDDLHSGRFGDMAPAVRRAES